MEGASGVCEMKSGSSIRKNSLDHCVASPQRKIEIIVLDRLRIVVKCISFGKLCQHKWNVNAKKLFVYHQENINDSLLLNQLFRYL